MSKGLLRLAVIAPIAILLLITFQQTGTLQGPRGAEAAFSGDFNCDGSVNTQDVIAVLAVSGEVQPLSSCANAVSVDCDGDTDVTDALVLLHYLAATSVSLPAECSDINSLIPGTSPQDAADQLSARITGGGSLMDVIEAVQESLARGGVSTGDANGTTYTQAFAPAASSVAIPMEVLNLALEARDATSEYRMDAAQIGQMLADFGWPFLAAPTPGAQVVAMLKELVTGAQALPNDPNSFTPLFLEDMGKIQDPPVDLAAGSALPKDVHFNMLDLQLLVAIFDRQAVYTNETQSDVAWPAAGDPCTEAKKVLSGVLGPFGGQVDGILVNEAGPHFIEKALELAGAEGAATIGQALGSLGIVARLWKLIDFYSSVQVAVNRDGAHSQHKPLEDDGPEVRRFTATAGLSEEDWKAYQEANTGADSEINKAVRDCMNSVGLNVLSGLGDIAKDAENWKVDWTISNNDLNLRRDQTVTWSPDDQFQPGGTHGTNWRSGMVKESEFSSGAQFMIRVGTERQSDHVHPVVKTDDVVVCGAVFAAEPPDLATFVNAVKGPIGLIESIAELGAGWLQTINGPQACRVLTVTWHEPCTLGQAPQSVRSADGATSFQPSCTYNGTVSFNFHSTAFGGSESSTSGTVAFTAQDDPHTNGIEYVASGGSLRHTYHNFKCHGEGTTGVASGGLTAYPDTGHYFGSVSSEFVPAFPNPGTTQCVGQFAGEAGDAQIGSFEVGRFIMSPDGQTLDGSYTEASDDQFGHYSWEYSWHLTGSCSAAAAVTPEGVCGGAVSGLPNP